MLYLLQYYNDVPRLNSRLKCKKALLIPSKIKKANTNCLKIMRIMLVKSGVRSSNELLISYLAYEGLDSTKSADTIKRVGPGTKHSVFECYYIRKTHLVVDFSSMRSNLSNNDFRKPSK